MSDTPAADEAGTELVLDAGKFTGPERDEVQNRFETSFGDLLTYTYESIRSGRTYRLAPIERRDGSLVFPDQVIQFMVWVQARRTDPDVKLEDFDELTVKDLANARARGINLGKASGPESSTTSSPGSSSAGSSRASRGRNRAA